MDIQLSSLPERINLYLNSANRTRGESASSFEMVMANTLITADTMKSIEDNDQIIFKYASESGVISEEFNPNGSLNNIAGISNSAKNVFGMMPHPERAADGVLSNLDGKAIFESLLKYC